MCFSAEVSFGASAVISVVGAVAVIKTQTIPQRIFAVIPLLFAFQQFFEGILWLSLPNPDNVFWQQSMTYLFLIFAFIVWPIWVTFSVMLLEKSGKRKRALVILFVLGSMMALYHTYCLLTYEVHSEIMCHHIFYSADFPLHRPKFSGLIYFIITVIPFFISSIKRMKLLGIIFLVSYIVTKIFYFKYLVSIWCFFAAVMSMMVLLIVLRLREDKKLPVNSY